MESTIIYIIGWGIFILILASIFFLRKTGLLKDSTTVINDKSKQPYSFSRVQIAWWTVIIIGSFIYLYALQYKFLTSGFINLFSTSALALLGISSATTAIGRIIDTNQEQSTTLRNQDQNSEGFFKDILSDDNGISIYRFQCLIFNIVYGLIFIHIVLRPETIKMPEFNEIELALIGISSSTYLLLKSRENNIPTHQPEG